MSSEHLRVGAIGTYGNGNLGDEAIFVAFLQWLQQHAPEVAPVSLCANPTYIEQKYGVPAFAVSASHTIEIPADVSSAQLRPAAVTAGRPVSQPPRRFANHLREMLKRFLPGPIRLLRSSQQIVKRVLAAARYFPTQLRVARSLDGVMVLGGGQIHDFWEGPLGHPMTLFLWALASRVSRTPFMIASIGAVDLGNRLSRWFVGTAVRWSTYATVRDAPTARIIRSLGIRNSCQILPDLAWGLQTGLTMQQARRAPLPARMPPSQPRIIGVCPMVYRHPELWPAGEVAAYDNYIGKLASFCSGLVREGYDVVLFPTQIRSDVVAINDIASRIAPELMEHVVLWRVDGIAELLSCLSAVDIVVSTRFHGLLLALLAGRPALSLSYQPKNAALLDEFGQVQFALDVDDFSVDALWERFSRLRNEFSPYATRIRLDRERRCERLHDQYRQVLQSLGWRAAAPTPEAAAESQRLGDVSLAPRRRDRADGQHAPGFKEAGMVRQTKGGLTCNPTRRTRPALPRPKRAHPRSPQVNRR
jgi:polysaccharide pyruvyl transferase WcaK-like protein